MPVFNNFKTKQLQPVFNPTGWEKAGLVQDITFFYRQKPGKAGKTVWIKAADDHITIGGNGAVYFA